MVIVSGDIFVQIGLVTIIAALAAFILRLIKQPQVLAYVVVGILITPVFKIVTNTSIIESMSTIGIAFLLFIVLFISMVWLGAFLSGKQIHDFLPIHLDQKQSPGDGRNQRLDDHASSAQVQVRVRIFTPNQSK